ncbi:MAG: hypothetical protein Q8M65_04555, partial [Rhodoglobus sp.]|nr:hypothetical protein [Rhodoglobus sp.]
GSFSAASGSRLIAASAVVGADGALRGVLSATGAGTRIDIAQGLDVGVGAPGTVSVNGGAAFSAGRTLLGFYGSGVGAVSVAGAGSTWTSAHALIVGHSGYGSFSVANGAEVSIGELIIGSIDQGVAGAGSVVVSGSGSRLLVNGPLVVGNPSTGNLSITVGGLVASTGLTSIGANGRIVLDGGTLRSASVDLDMTRLDWRSGVLQISGVGGAALGQGGLPTLLQMLPGRTLAVDQTLTISADSALLLSGGSLRAGTVVLQRGLLASTGGGANALQMGDIGLLLAEGQVGARIVGGNVGMHRIVTSGALTLGLLTHDDGFAFGGQLEATAGNQVVLLDRGLAELGHATLLTDGAQLATFNGARLGADATLLTSGTPSVQGRFVNGGQVRSTG